MEEERCMQHIETAPFPTYPVACHGVSQITVQLEREKDGVHLKAEADPGITITIDRSLLDGEGPERKSERSSLPVFPPDTPFIKNVGSR